MSWGNEDAPRLGADGAGEMDGHRATGGSPNMKRSVTTTDLKMGVLRPPDSLAHRTPACKPLSISAGDRGGSLAISEIFDNRSCHT